VRRWVGHPEGAWDGMAWSCATHADSSRWGPTAELRFMRRAHRVPVRSAVRLARARLFVFTMRSWTGKDWRG